MNLIKNFSNFISLCFILLVFWFCFWFLNGLDKFYNGKFEPMVENGLEKSVLVDNVTGQITHKQYGYEVNGMFGGNRNAKMTTFFERIGMSKDVAMFSLYTIAVVEIFLASLFFIAVILFITKHHKESRVMYELGFKLSLMLFLVFTVGDILFGERIELWEHCTFMVLILLSYKMICNESNKSKHTFN